MAGWSEPACLIESDGWCCGLTHLQFDPSGSPLAGPLGNGLNKSLADPCPSVGGIDPHSAERRSLRRVIQNPDRHRYEFVPRCLHERDTAVARCNSLPPIGFAEPRLFFERTPERVGRVSYRLKS